MLPEKQITTNTDEQKSGQTPRRRKAQGLPSNGGNADQDRKFVTVIHPENLTSIAENQENSGREYLVSWLFLIGSLMFLFDGFLELAEGISIHVAIHLVASILFTIGSVLFIPTNKK